ncbi:MAG: 2-hydroxy-3-oxopropionate reductase [Anaerolineaceae bacterium]|nr:2-hydroxy-3-oxopropionate reductase [Anaerolineaceae bacterium]
MMTQLPQIAFIGLGIMGRPMAEHLIAAGYPLAVFDHHPEKLQPLISLGATHASSCAEAATHSDLVISMVPDSPDVEQVALGPGGILEAARPGLIYIDMSSISPVTARKVAATLSAQGVRCLDAPVSGGETGAKNASLSIMVGGDPSLLEEVRPVLSVMGKTITHCGAPGAGQVVKTCNQVQVALNFIGMAEALVLGSKAGVDPAVILRVLSGGYAQTRVMDVRGARIIHGDFEPGFKSKFHYKDLNIILETARQLEVPLPATALAHELFSALLSAGRGDLDHSAVITVLEDLAHVQARTREE